jgi:hypothetical protein
MAKLNPLEFPPCDRVFTVDNVYQSVGLVMLVEVPGELEAKFPGWMKRVSFLVIN